MKKEDLWSEYAQSSQVKAERREQKGKRKKMIVQGKNVFGLLRMKVKKQKENYVQ